ncbi:nucleotide exchange factor GrpE [Streptomyces piniterrae]|uniref:Protein GrpE n=1 Tax=Streptomyces piniterrae TaxID=2571125 RepID=A0A4U0MV14_9ACTN|nr:nucleotide exchange factor GrpE [Streptomyces piniterrae]TJZ44566.1 nucleotide exchange factor GrpE [Streptomyces piniterrae]
MNRSTDARGGSRPQLALVRGGPGDGRTALPDRAARSAERTGRAAGGPAGRDGATARPPSAEAELRAELREITADLQRLKAEYDNYRKRIRRDRLAVRQIAVANVLGRLLPVLDALAEARAQGELTGGFRRVAEALETELAALGLEPIGTTGEAFDPRVHEALSYSQGNGCETGDGFAPAERRTSAEAPACASILRLGYRVGDHLLRPAQVAVAESARPR